MGTTTQRTSVPTGGHWGIYNAEVENGTLVGVRPFDKDPHPSPLLGSVVSTVYAETRIKQPMIRKGWLEHGHRSDRAARGVEPFVSVSWDKALDLVAAELA